MDPLESLLSGPRARNAFLLRSLMTPPWCIRVEDEAPLTVVVVQHGSAWILREGRVPLDLRAGDAMLIRGPEPYLVAHAPGAEPTAIIHPGQHCTGPGGEDFSDLLDSGLRTWGNDPNGGDALLIGTYLTASEVGRALLDRLPLHYVLRQNEQLEPAVGLLLDELGAPLPARQRRWTGSWICCSSGCCGGRRTKCPHPSPAGYARSRIP
ncbi:AraC family transcriptional regulator [Arthrobacter crystallopoietes BAB-32]|uniref:AraC family transcriptional regulator n=1 Tax=Arthrobacter crystallopoietes BAB-32 TaxID=1246476 RepID=N1V206_9MICC|nr:cupin domain-containing protein [Arthrobacter crystallopoietes]EMY34034.1 AraC family transcriptional regulator [Arthrobacter crystallopoietes BAB-32]